MNTVVARIIQYFNIRPFRERIRNVNLIKSIGCINRTQKYLEKKQNYDYNSFQKKCVFSFHNKYKSQNIFVAFKLNTTKMFLKVFYVTLGMGENTLKCNLVNYTNFIITTIITKSYLNSWANACSIQRYRPSKFHNLMSIISNNFRFRPTHSRLIKLKSYTTRFSATRLPKLYIGIALWKCIYTHRINSNFRICRCPNTHKICKFNQ